MTPALFDSVVSRQPRINKINDQEKLDRYLVCGEDSRKRGRRRAGGNVDVPGGGGVVVVAG